MAPDEIRIYAEQRARALPGTWFDETAAKVAAEFFPSYLRHTEGEWAGRPFRLALWQEEIVRAVFGWKRADGTRFFRKATIWVARKNGKTEFVAGLALLALVADGEFGGQGYCLAKDKNQALILFRKAVAMTAMSPELTQVLETYTTSVFCPELNAALKPLSGKPDGKHGFSASFMAGDELHEWPDDRLYTFVHQSTAARRQPLEVLISTAGMRGASFGWDWWEHCLKVRSGIVPDEGHLVVIFAAGPEDDWTLPETWAKANPNLDVSVKRDYLSAECERARENPRLENDFRRYHLNQWVGQVTRWIPLERWDACCAERTGWHGFEHELAGRECFGGLDLSSTSDITALVWVFPPLEGETTWRVLPRFWVPGDNAERRALRDRVPYDTWERENALAFTGGNVADYAAIKAQVYADAERFRVKGIAIDRWNATQISVELQEEGLPVVLFGQGYASMSAPSKEFERLVFAGLLDHGGQPVLRWMLENVAIAEDPAGNIKPAKDRSAEKIDGIVSTIMGIGLSMTAPREGPSVYEDRPMLVF